MSELVQVRDDAQLALQRNDVGAGAVRRGIAGVVVNDAEGQDSLLGEDDAKILVKGGELALLFLDSSPVRLARLEALDGGITPGRNFIEGSRISATLAG